MRKKKVYLSGPITSLPLEDARRIFESAEEFIEKLGHTAVNPMKNGLTPESTWEEHMKRDLAMLLECDTICMLPNFRESKGAMLELDVAIALGMNPLRYTPAFWYNASLAEKHLNDTIEEPSRSWMQVVSDNLSEINKMLNDIRQENLEGLQILKGNTPDKPTSNVITNRPFIHPNLLGKRTEPTPYAKIQRRADFLDNFKDGWALFNSNALFRTIAMLVMNGASEYDLMLELIFMIDGHTAPDTSHLKPFHKQKPTDNETE